MTEIKLVGDGPFQEVDCSMQLSPDQYIPHVFLKDLIVLHYTAGMTASGAFNWWSATPERVAASYLVDLDGRIYCVYPPECWAYHLGIKGSNGAHDMRSIAIEIVNAGPLKREGTNLMWWPENFHKVYCRMEEASSYVEVKYRGFRYHAAYTAAQMSVIPSLVKRLCDEFNIPHEIPRATLQMEVDPIFNTWKGIASHQNFRKDKMDVGPAFNWDLLAA